MDKITIPYFYIIRHINSNKLYAGSKWGKGCHPSTFMTPDGYKTSSNTINNLIQLEGLESFEILRIDTNLDGLSAFEYETLFLQTLNCSSSDEWFNLHNNNGGMHYSHPYFILKSKESKLLKYNDPYFNREKINKTFLEKFGSRSPFGDIQIREKSKITLQNNYGVDNAFKSPIVKEKIKETCLEKFGVPNSMQNKNVQNKAKNTNRNNHGGILSIQTPEGRRISSITMTKTNNNMEIIYCEICGISFKRSCYCSHLKSHENNSAATKLEIDIIYNLISKYNFKDGQIKRYIGRYIAGLIPIRNYVFSEEYQIKTNVELDLELILLIRHNLYKCEICDKLFPNLSHMERHLESHKNGTVPSKEEIGIIISLLDKGISVNKISKMFNDKFTLQIIRGLSKQKGFIQLINS